MRPTAHGTHFQDFKPDTSKEWLETNGLGDYASSTICDCNTRRYHGLLTVNLEHFGRHVLLSNLEDWLISDEQAFPLSSRHHPLVVYPDGARHQTAFSASPCPSFTYEAGDYLVKRELMLQRGRHTLLVRYSVTPRKATRDQAGKKKKKVMLRIIPLLAFRSFHALTHANMDLQVKTFPAESGFKIQPYNSLPPLFIQVDGNFTFYPSPEWIRQVEYPLEQERGFDYAEDLFSPGALEVSLCPGEAIIISASTEEIPASEEDSSGPQRLLMPYWELESTSRGKQVPKNLREFLARQNAAFLIRTPTGGSALLAGYPWFGSWGRDTLISLPGTAFFAGRRSEGISVLRRLLRGISDGLIPNTFTADGHPGGYNSVDASLWFGWCAQQLLRSRSRLHPETRTRILRELLPVLTGIIESYRAGRIPFVREDSDGLLEVGTPSTQLTWMDAQVDGKPVTPRDGYPVEIEALWYNTLELAHRAALELREKGPCTAAQLRRVRATFASRFVKQDGSLYDVWRPQEAGNSDASVRPNQLFAISLPYAVLEESHWQPVLDTVRRQLLTPYGLRTLAPTDEKYHSSYAGGPQERDSAYHQGCVWPWLLGAYADALFKTVRAASDEKHRSKALDKAASEFLSTIEPLFTKHLNEAGVGYISEIFSPESPFHPDGCIAQAWSSAEILRALIVTHTNSHTVYERWEKHLKWRNS